MHVAFGLGKAFEDTKDYVNAFKYFKIANNLRRKNLTLIKEIQFMSNLSLNIAFVQKI